VQRRRIAYRTPKERPDVRRGIKKQTLDCIRVTAGEPPARCQIDSPKVSGVSSE